MPAVVDPAFTAELVEVCAEAASLHQAQNPSDWWGAEMGLFGLEDFRAALALHLETDAEHLDPEACRRCLAGIEGVYPAGDDWWSLSPPAARLAEPA